MAKRSTRSGSEWRCLVGELEASGQSVRVFAVEHGLSEASLYAWRRKVGATPVTPDQQPVFLPLGLLPTAKDSQITIELRCGRRLELPESITATRLAEIVSALEARLPEASSGAPR